MKRSLKIFIFFVSLIALNSCSQDKEKKELLYDGILTVGMDLSYPPFEGVDKNGKPEGISVEMAKSLAQYLNLKLDIKNTSWAGLIPGLQTKKFDIVISSLTITEERKNSIGFSVPYAKLGLSLLFSKKSSYKNEQDLKKGKPRLIVRKGTIGDQIAYKLFPNAEIFQTENVPAMILEVSQSKADAAIYDPLTLYQSHLTYPSSTVLNLKPITGSVGEWGIGIAKENTKLKEKIDAFILDYKSKGKFDELSFKYLKDIQKEFKKQGIPFFFN